MHRLLSGPGMPSSRIAIEVDGPSHFLLADGRGVRKPNGPTLLPQAAPPRGGWLEGDKRPLLRVGWLD